MGGIVQLEMKFSRDNLCVISGDVGSYRKGCGRRGVGCSWEG